MCGVTIFEHFCVCIGIYGHMIGHASHVTKCTLKVSTDAYQGSGAKEREAERPFLKERIDDLYSRIGLVPDDRNDQADQDLVDQECKGDMEKCTCMECTLSLQRNIVELMATLPSILGNREASMKLAEIYRSHPGVFCSRKLYLAVHKLFVMFTFPLRVRRQIFNWFFSQVVIHTCTHTHIHTHIYTYTHTYTYSNVQSQVRFATLLNNFDVFNDVSPPFYLRVYLPYVHSMHR